MFLSNYFRYVYLPYEFICTVQWEYDKVFTVFISVTSFVIPLIVTVVCYLSISRVAYRQVRDKPPVNIGNFSATDFDPTIIPDVSKVTIPDVSEAEVVDRKGQVLCGKENRAFMADSECNKVKASLAQGESESTVVKLAEHNNSAVQGPSRKVKMFDQERDPDHRKHVAGKPENVVTGKERKEQNSVSRSVGGSHINPFIIVVASGNTETSAKHSADPNTYSSARIGKSRVSPAAAVSSVRKPWIEENPQREELVVIQEKDEETDSRKDFVSQKRSAAQKRGWMAERRTEDRRYTRSVRNSPLISLESFMSFHRNNIQPTRIREAIVHSTVLHRTLPSCGRHMSH